MEMGKRNNIVTEKLIVYLMIITPFIDLLNGLFQYTLGIDLPIGLVVRSCILVAIIFIYIMQERSNFNKFIAIVGLFLVQLLIISYNSNIDIVDELSFISKIYYNIFLMFIVGKLFKNNNIDCEYYVDKLVVVGLIITLSLMVTRVLGIGINSYGESGGYKGLFMGLNDLTAVLVMTFPFIVYKMISSNKKLKYGIYSVIVGTNILLTGTKTSMALLALIIIFFMYQTAFKQKKISSAIVIIIALSVFAIIFKKYLWDIYSSTVLARQKYFLGQQNPITYLLSARNQTLMTAFEYWAKDGLNIIFGLGFTNGSSFIASFLTGHGMIEMDLFDVLYFYGVIFCTIVFVPIISTLLKAIKVLIKSKSLLYETIALVYISTFIISLLGGHVIVSPLAGIYFVIIYGMLKVDKLEVDKS